VVIHPGAGAERKCWPIAKYLELAGELSRSGRLVEVILGEVELERWPAAQIESFAKVAKIHKPATLVELSDRIAKASAFVGNDSGPGHLAGMLGVRTISIFGPNDPARWKPVGPGVMVVQGQWEAISAKQIVGLIGN
jgi:ADP-heptose:LPS heptosyltransferase